MPDKDTLSIYSITGLTLMVLSGGIFMFNTADLPDESKAESSIEQVASQEETEDPYAKNTEWVAKAGHAIEHWTVANPNEGIPLTDDYVPYKEYISELSDDATFPDSEHTYIRVVANDSAKSSFTVCSYRRDEGPTDLTKAYIFGFDSATQESGLQTRGICLL